MKPGIHVTLDFRIVVEPWPAWLLFRLGRMAGLPGVPVRAPSGVKPGFHYIPRCLRFNLSFVLGLVAVHSGTCRAVGVFVWRLGGGMGAAAAFSEGLA